MSIRGANPLNSQGRRLVHSNTQLGSFHENPIHDNPDKHPEPDLGSRQLGESTQVGLCDRRPLVPPFCRR